LIASAMTAGLGLFLLCASFDPTRRLLERTVLPAPGEGPTKETRDRGFFVIHFIAETEGDADARDAPTRFRGRIEGKSDPGYGETAKMLGESAMCLALDRDRTSTEGGVLTPASCMGMRLVERLRDAGMVFEVT